MGAVHRDVDAGAAHFSPPQARSSVVDRLPWAALIDVLLLALTVVAADAGVLSEADGVVVALASALLRPPLIPYLLFLVAGFQDAKGLSGNWWYGGTVALGCATLLVNGGRLPEPLQHGRRDYRDLAGFALLVIVYAVASSYVQRWFGIHEQASTREPIVVGLLAVAMLTFGSAAWESISADPRAERRICAVFWLTFLNGLAVSIARLFFGYQSFVSVAGAAGMEAGGEQLFEDTPLGFPRMTGTYLTPIGFAMYIGYLLLLWQAMKREQSVRSRFVLLYCFVGLVLALTSLSKGMAIFFVITSLAFATVRARLLVPVVLVAASLVLVGVAYVGGDAILEAFRFESGTSVESYRAVAWSAILNTFKWTDWVFGTGIAYWPVFLQRTVGFSLSDPHSYLFSIPGTYGLAGMAFYLMLALFLYAAFRRATGYLRMVAVALATMFFVVDATSIPYVIGNTPITMLIWTALSALGMHAVDSRGAGSA
jgi:hypothetical protein